MVMVTTAKMISLLELITWAIPFDFFVPVYKALISSTIVISK